MSDEGSQDGSPQSDVEQELVRYETIKEFCTDNDIEINENTTSIDIHASRVKTIDTLDICAESLQELHIVASLVNSLKGAEIFKNLKHLELYQNKVGSIDSSHLPSNLKILDLSFNKIRNISWLKKLSETLTHLYLSSNKIENVNIIPEMLLLEVLELGNNRIRSPPQDMHKIIGLQELWLGKNKIVSMDIPLLPNLRVLDMRSNRLKEWSHSILQLENLEELYLSHNALNDIPDDFFKDKLPKLKSLDLASNLINNADSIKHLTELTELYLDYNKLDEKIVAILPSLTELEAINLSHNVELQKNYGPMYRNTILEIIKKHSPKLDTFDGDYLRKNWNL